MLVLCYLFVRYCVVICVGAYAVAAINFRKIVKNKKDSLCYLLCYFLCRFFVNTFEHFRFFVRLFPPFYGGDTRPFLCGFLRFFRRHFPADQSGVLVLFLCALFRTFSGFRRSPRAYLQYSARLFALVPLHCLVNGAV